MNRFRPGDDDTIRVPRPAQSRPARRRAGWFAGLGAALLLAAAGIGAWTYLSRPPAIPIDTRSEAQIDATQPCQVKISYLAADPAIVVIDFPSLTTQGLTLNRVAALIEKARLPRDRVLDDAALYEAIYSCGDTVESYYYGHDYKAADLRKFFRLAAAQHVSLNPHELWLKRLLNQLGWLAPEAVGAIITLPAAGGPITQEMRAVILHHEISHGAFYTNPTYAAYAESFWYSLNDDQRADFRNFLGREGYDTRNTNLMLNETQAYLVFTRDPLFFDAQAVNMTDAEIAELQARYIAGMPDFWLKPLANEPLPVGPPQPACRLPANG